MAEAWNNNGNGASSKAAPLISDPWLLVSALALTAFGLVMVYSSSSALAGKRYLDSAHFFKHQLFHVLVGLGVMTWLASLDYERYRRWVWYALGGVLLALVLVLIPGIGHRAGGAARWLRLGIISVQPAELAKVALVLFLARYLAEHQAESKSLFKVFMPCLAVAGALVLPILAEPDLGMSLTLLSLTMVMLGVAGTRVTYLAVILAAAVPLLYRLVWLVPYRRDRVFAFLNPWEDPAGTGFQIIHSFLALGSGGFWGTGLGGSKQKLFYLPEPHTDFILAVLGEELGLWGLATVLALFLVLVWRGVQTALNARDLFGTYLALGCTLIVGLQAFVNAAVVMGMLPTKGLTLPFLSYGGSSIVTNFACVGLLLSVAGHQGRRA
ncbi:MAG: putative lipid II flippase FtsW [Desulfarculus sp.]|nr:putative lipid II flippase FtsW [Desulfarculus sp.]